MTPISSSRRREDSGPSTVVAAIRALSATTNSPSPAGATTNGPGLCAIRFIQRRHRRIFHSCAIRLDLTVACWGDNNEGNPKRARASSEKLSPSGGIPARSETTSPSPAGATTNGPSRCAGRRIHRNLLGMTHTCAIRDDFTVACWGDNQFGQADAPAGKFIDVSVSQDYSCGVRDDFTVACWGDNRFGRADAPAGLAPIQVVYAVPSDVEPLAGRDMAIAQEVSEIQAWFRGQTAGGTR